MTEQPKDGGAAFPTGLTPGHYSQQGMSLRDWVAGQHFASYGVLEAVFQRKDETVDEAISRVWRERANTSFIAADAFIAAREATQ